MEIINQIKTALENCKEEKFNYKLINEYKVSEQFKNEFLFFIKPEITLLNPSIKLDDILIMIFDKIKLHHFNVKNIRILTAKYLDKYNIIAQHYGVINQLSNNASEQLSADARSKFEDLFERRISSSKLLGSLEFIKSHPSVSPTALDYLWQNSKFEKLAGGTYCAHLKIDGEEVFLVNGFHPRQLEHFTQDGKSIIALTLQSDTNWDNARQNFIGSTNPASAVEGSIRKELYNKQEIYGLQAVTASWNGVHLSAGPVEGLVELIRYNSDLTTGKKLDYSDFSFGQKLKQNFNEETINKILTNENVTYQGKSTSVFDVTEEKNSDEAIDILKNSSF